MGTNSPASTCWAGWAAGRIAGTVPPEPAGGLCSGRRCLAHQVSQGQEQDACTRPKESKGVAGRVRLSWQVPKAEPVVPAHDPGTASESIIHSQGGQGGHGDEEAHGQPQAMP